MKTGREVKLYNMLLPIWALVFFPTYLWILLIPANFIIDWIVLYFGAGDVPDKKKFMWRNTWKVCIFGFLSDFIGAIILFVAASLFGSDWGSPHTSFTGKICDGILFDPFSNILSFVIVAFAVAVSGLCIYRLDRSLLKKAGLDAERAKKAAMILAMITAPYIYFFPMNLVYN